MAWLSISSWAGSTKWEFRPLFASCCPKAGERRLARCTRAIGGSLYRRPPVQPETAQAARARSTPTRRRHPAAPECINSGTTLSSTQPRPNSCRPFPGLTPHMPPDAYNHHRTKRAGMTNVSLPTPLASRRADICERHAQNKFRAYLRSGSAPNRRSSATTGQSWPHAGQVWPNLARVVDRIWPTMAKAWPRFGAQLDQNWLHSRKGRSECGRIWPARNGEKRQPPTRAPVRATRRISAVGLLRRLQLTHQGVAAAVIRIGRGLLADR